MTNQYKQKGDLGNMCIMLAFQKLGWSILIPLTEQEPYDFVAERSGTFIRVQSKYRTPNAQNVLDVRFRKTWVNSSGNVSKPIDKSLIDMYAIYCPDTDNVYAVDPKKHKKGIQLKLHSDNMDSLNNANNFLLTSYLEKTYG